jgi:hypothetical protein
MSLPRSVSSLSDSATSSLGASEQENSGMNPLVTCLINWSKKLQKQTGQARDICASVKSVQQGLNESLDQVLVQHRAVEVLQNYLDMQAEDSAGVIMIFVCMCVSVCVCVK